MDEVVLDELPAPIEIKSPDSQVSLREFTSGDAQELFDLINRNRDFLSRHDVPVNYRGSEDVQRSIDSKRKYGAISFCIRDLNNTLIGTCYIQPSRTGPRIAEIGYYLGEEFTGKGNGSQAIRLLCGFGFEKFKLEEIRVSARKDNISSQRALESCGFKMSELSPLFQKPSEKYIYYSLTPPSLIK